MKFKKRILTSILAISLTASVGIPVSGLAMAQDTVNDDNSKTENEIVFTADGGNEVLSINKPQEGGEEEKPEEPEDPEKPYHEDDYGDDLELDSKFVTLERDYAQKLTVKVKNNTKKPMNYYLKAENPNDDIYLNFVQEGSEDAPLTIEPGAEKEIELSIFLQNASQKEYSIPVVAMASNGDSGAEFEQVSRHTVDFKCNHGNVSYSLVAGEIDEETLTQTYYVRNNGDDVSDLTISVGEDVSRYLSVSPLIENYYLEEGGEVSFTVKPDFFNMDEDDMATVTGPIIATGGAAKQELAATFKMPENYNTIEAWRLALYQDDNPYYTINETPTITDNISVNVSALNDDMVTREDVENALGISSETGMIVLSQCNQEYTYTDKNGENQSIRLETTISTTESEDKNKTGTVSHSYHEGNDEVIFETNIYLSGDETKKYVSDYLDDARDSFNMKKNAADIANEIYKEINGKDMDDSTLNFTTKMTDTGWGILRNNDSTKNFVNVIDKIDNTWNEAIDASKMTDYLSVINNPTYSEEFKQETASEASLFSLEKLLNKGADIVPGGGFYTRQWETALDIIKRMTDTRHHPKSNDELGLYDKEDVKGSQCTNAGEITNNPDSKVGSGTKNGSASDWIGSFFDWMDFNSWLGNEWDGDSESLLKRAENYSNRRKANKKIAVQKVGGEIVAAAETNEIKENADNNSLEKPDNINLVFMTGRIESVEEDYTDTTVTRQTVRVNGTEIGTVSTDGLSELFIVGLITDVFNLGTTNKIDRIFNTNPGSHSIDTDTEYNTFISPNALIAYTGSLDNIEDIRALPDFAVYPENILSEKDSYVGDSNPITVKLYNRGPKGGWVDVEIKIEGESVYNETNKYIGAFTGNSVTFNYTPTKENHNISVYLNNKTVYANERNNKNNSAMKNVKFKRYEDCANEFLTQSKLKGILYLRGGLLFYNENKYDSLLQEVKVYILRGGIYGIQR